jgi:ribosome-associated protein
MPAGRAQMMRGGVQASSEEHPDRQPDARNPSESAGAGDDGIELAPGVRVPAGVVRATAVRASGPGGQNVNRRSTKVELRVRVGDLPLKGWQAERLRRLAGARLTSDDELILTAETERTQGANRRVALDRLRVLLIESMHRPAVRKPTRPTRGSVERRLRSKREQGEKKKRRQDRDLPE